MSNERKGVLVFADSLTMIEEITAKAQSLHERIAIVVIGCELDSLVSQLQHVKVSEIIVADAPSLKYFKSDLYADMLIQAIEHFQPSSILIGSSEIGKSVACLVATHYHTGVTADCTQLEIHNERMLQIRPAFGGNIMANIVTDTNRLEFATIRKGVFRSVLEQDKDFFAKRHNLNLHDTSSKLEMIDCQAIMQNDSIRDAKMIFVAGNGFQNKQDLDKLHQLANLMGATVGSTRALVEKGWMSKQQQIGLSGSSVYADIVITFGVSGSIQFLAGISNCKCIIAINDDPEAIIFKKAHYCITEDLYNMLDNMLLKYTHLY